jgi:hypothetical protein
MGSALDISLGYQPWASALGISLDHDGLERPGYKIAKTTPCKESKGFNSQRFYARLMGAEGQMNIPSHSLVRIFILFIATIKATAEQL